MFHANCYKYHFYVFFFFFCYGPFLELGKHTWEFVDALQGLDDQSKFCAGGCWARKVSSIHSRKECLHQERIEECYYLHYFYSDTLNTSIMYNPYL